MKQNLLSTLGLIVLVMVAFATSPDAAQITAPGPYYPTPSWDQKLPASSRFIVLSNWGSAAVLDRETGLVWEKSPSAGTTHFVWILALEHCSALTVGDRTGWRLPVLQELASLVDPSVSAPGPTLPSGHPFQNVQTGGYWSATTHAEISAWARVVSLYDGTVVNGDKAGLGYTWCVRGGQGVDAQ
jgi:hypothetical protein